MIQNILSISAVVIFSIASLFAQEIKDDEKASKEVIVHLKDDSQLRGEVNEWVIGEYIDLKTSWTESLVVTSDRIKKVVQLSASRGLTKKSGYNYQETGLYAIGKVQLITGNNGDRANEVNGYGVSLSAGKKYSRWVALGVGIGMDRYVSGTGENLYPLFVEYTSFFNQKNNSLFFNMQTGYSFAFKRDRYSIIEAKGGLMVYPSLGVRLGSQDIKYTIDVGYKFQNAEFTYRDNWGGGTSEERLTYKRLAIRFGVLI